MSNVKIYTEWVQSQSDQSISNQINLNQCKSMYTNNIQSYAYNYNKIHSESHKFN